MDASLFQTLKTSIVRTVGLSQDALHVHVGLMVFILLALSLRKRGFSWLPFAAAVCAALLGELLDMRDDLATRGFWRVGASIHDIINTAFWPLLLTLLARWWTRSKVSSSSPPND
jgi:hypothetical protein